MTQSSGIDETLPRPATGRRLPQAPARADIAALLFYAVLALIVLLPYLRPVATLPGAPGDNIEYLYKQRLFIQTLTEGRLWPFATHNVFYPFSYDLRGGNMTLLNLALAMPVTLVAGEVAGYLWVAFLTFTLCGFSAYLLALLITRRRGPSLIAGLLFSLSAYQIYLLNVGHFDHFAAYWIPLTMLFIELAIRRRQRRFGVTAGVIFGLTGLCSWNFAYMLALFIAIYVLVRTWPPTRALRDRPLLSTLAWFVVVGVAILAPFAILLRQYDQGGLSFSLAYTDAFSVDLLSLLGANPAHPLAGASVIHQAAVTPLGWLALALVGVGLWRQRSRTVSAWAVVFVVAVVLALGVTLHLGGQRLVIPVPEMVERGFTRVMSLLTERWALQPSAFWPMQQEGSIFVPLPAYPMYLFVPFFNALRGSANFLLLAHTAIAVLAAVALSALRGRYRHAVLAGVAALALFELLPAPGAYGRSEVLTQPLTAWLQARPDGGAVARFPIQKWTNGPDMYDAFISGHPVTDGYVPFQPRQWREAFPTLDAFPAAATLDQLARWGIKYVVASPAAYGERWPQVEQQITASGRLRPLDSVDYISRYRDARITPEPPAAPGSYVHVAEWQPQSAGTVLDTLRIYELAP